ncbi:MAG: hypothetical protein IPK00_24495 [Deltaproteobacteria bacterium]|nr:hypothetical protein [Deltaproteobacteria bacterium]
MADDGRKLSYSERDRMRREGKGAGRSERPQSGHDRALEEKRSRLALAAAEELFTDEKGGQLGKTLANAVREAHGSKGLAAACQAYLEKVGPPSTGELASIFLDAGRNRSACRCSSALLQQKGQGKLGSSRAAWRQIRLLGGFRRRGSPSRAEDLLA